MREQKGSFFHRYKSWFVRFRDDVVQPDGTIKRELICKKLEVEYGGEYRTVKSVRPFAAKLLAPLNAGLLNPQSTMMVSDFVDKVYLPKYVETQLRPATQKQYKDIWNNHLKPRLGKLTLRDFRTVHGEGLLAKIAEQAKLGRSSLKHCKAFLSGCFKQAKRLGILDGINPMMDTSIPSTPEPEDTYAYDLAEIKAMLSALSEPAHTIVLTAALTGLRKSEIRGLQWEDFNGKKLTVRRSVWNSTTSDPKTRKSSAPIPVVKQLADALEKHKAREGKLAQSDLPIFQGGTGQPMNLDNLVRREIVPALSRCGVCGKPEEEHKPEGHEYQRDQLLPQWHGWHAFRRGLATNLHDLGVDDKTIQAILRHTDIRLTQNTYIKTVEKSQVSAMDVLAEKFEITTGRIQ